MAKYLKNLNRLIADMWVAGNAGPITLHTRTASGEYFYVYSGDLMVDSFRTCYLEDVRAALKGAGWNTRHAQAMAAGLRKQPIHMKSVDATNDLRTVFYLNGKGRIRHVQIEAGMNTPAIMLYLAYRRYSNRLNRQIKSLQQRENED